VRHGVQQRGSQLLALPRGFHLRREILRKCTLQAIATRLAMPCNTESAMRTPWRAKTGDRLRTEPHSSDHSAAFGI